MLTRLPASALTRCAPSLHVPSHKHNTSWAGRVNLVHAIYWANRYNRFQTTLIFYPSTTTTASAIDSTRVDLPLLCPSAALSPEADPLQLQLVLLSSLTPPPTWLMSASNDEPRCHAAHLLLQEIRRHENISKASWVWFGGSIKPADPTSPVHPSISGSEWAENELPQSISEQPRLCCFPAFPCL